MLPPTLALTPRHATAKPNLALLHGMPDSRIDARCVRQDALARNCAELEQLSL